MIVSSAMSIHVLWHSGIIGHHSFLEAGDALVKLGDVLGDTIDFIVVLKSALGLSEVLQLFWTHSFGQVAPILLLPVEI